MVLRTRQDLVGNHYVLDKLSLHKELTADPDKYQLSDSAMSTKGLLEAVLPDSACANAKLSKKVLDKAITNLTKYLKKAR